MKLPYFGFGAALAVTEAIIVLLVLLALGTVSACNDWWPILSCRTFGRIWLFVIAGLSWLGWKVLTDGQYPQKK